MRALLLIVFVFLANSLFSQTDFCAPGARWMYESNGTGQNPPRQSNYIYVGDTVIDGFSEVRILKEELRGYYFWGDTYYQEHRSYLRQSGDSLFQYVDGNFELAFDLGVEIGDTRVVYFSADLCVNMDTMLIENIDTIDYQGQPLRRYHYSLLVEDQMSQIEGSGFAGLSECQYIERIGFVIDHPVVNGYRCEGNLISEYQAKTFRCYTDNQLAINHPDTCNLFLGIEEEINHSHIGITNTAGNLQIKNAPNSTLRIYDILGKELFQTEVSSDYQSISLEHLPNGILFAVCESEYFRLVKKVLTSN